MHTIVSMSEFNQPKPEIPPFHNAVPKIDITELKAHPIRFLIAGKEYEMILMSDDFMQYPIDSKKCEERYLSINVNGDEQKTNLGIQIIRDDRNRLTSMLQIRKYFDNQQINPNKAPGLGRAMLVRAFEYLQEQANIHQQSIEDIIEAHPEISAYEPLSFLRWLELFDKLLLENGYTILDRGVYQKTYLPNTQIIA